MIWYIEFTKIIDTIYEILRPLFAAQSKHLQIQNRAHCYDFIQMKISITFSPSIWIHMHPQCPTLLGFFQQHEQGLSLLASVVEQYQKISLNSTCADQIGDFSVTIKVLQIVVFSGCIANLDT